MFGIKRMNDIDSGKDGTGRAIDGSASATLDGMPIQISGSIRVSKNGIGRQIGSASTSVDGKDIILNTSIVAGKKGTNRSVKSSNSSFSS